MFAGATAFNQPISSWNTSKVTGMRWMFLCATSFNQPIGSWNTSNVTDMSDMFYDATRFNRNLSTWNLSSVAAPPANHNGWYSMNNMFDGSGLSPANYGADLAGWASRPEQRGVALGASGIKYPATAAAAHTTLTNTDHWSISDAGPA
jgi:surface protein